MANHLKNDIMQNSYMVEIEGEIINTQQTKTIVFEKDQVSVYYIDGTSKIYQLNQPPQDFPTTTAHIIPDNATSDEVIV